jgi:RNA-directed DNA polymerase
VTKTKPFDITKSEVFLAYKTVKANKGAGGIDEISLQCFDEDTKGNLYKIWNRMSSGTYFPMPLKEIPIPKKSGGTRLLKIPTVADRIAQTVVKQRIEAGIDKIFLKDSYGYRPQKSAHDALEVTRKRCWEYDWVLEFDIVGLFDNISHQLLMKAVKKHVKEKWQKLYIERWLEGTGSNSAKGVPQGGVISPVLANLFMHYAFDLWVNREFDNVAWCRYADDGIIHCKTEKQANHVRRKLAKRMKECGLELHEKKTRIVYCKDSNRQNNHDICGFTFLGYEFRQRKAKGSEGKEFSSFLPAISKDAKAEIRRTIRDWHLLWMTNKTLEEIAYRLNPIIQGWINYYGKYGKRELANVLTNINMHLCMWFQRKHKRYRGERLKTKIMVERIAKGNPKLFAHWKIGVTNVFG